MRASHAGLARAGSVHRCQGIISAVIPLHLRIAGFLSYQGAVDLDFTRFDLACISGPNGAGKSTLLDAMTWVLFGQARKRDESLINMQSRAAEVALIFRYENTEYRVQRSLTRGKPAVLEFQVRQPAPRLEAGNSGADLPAAQDTTWKPLTERTLRETQARIEETLRLDYETFVNASFFLQGQADHFTQQSPGKRKDVLSNILGLQTWEAYKGRAADLRRHLEEELASIDGRLREIGAELAEETPRRQRLADLEAQLLALAAARRSQQSALQTLRKTMASIDQQRLFIHSRSAALQQSRSRLSSLEARLADRRAARAADAALTARAPQIEIAYRAWLGTVSQLQDWDKIASAFRDREKERLPLLESIAVERARLEAEQNQLLARRLHVDQQAPAIQSLESDLLRANERFAAADARLAERGRLNDELKAAREAIIALTSENDGLRVEMDRMKSRIETLRSASGAACPLCGQPLSEKHRQSTLAALEAEGQISGDRFRANKAAVSQRQAELAKVAAVVEGFTGADGDKLAASQAVTQHTERLDMLRALTVDWQSTGAGRLAEIGSQLEHGEFATKARTQLARLDEILSRLGYDAVAHDRTREAEQRQRTADDDHRRLESARAALAPLDNEIQNLETEISDARADLARQESDLEQARQAVDAASTDLGDLKEAESSYLELQEQENRLNQQVGAARQKVSVLEDLRRRQLELESARQDLGLTIGRHKVLERAFGKDGVPALLIEQALPEMETRANEVLDRLSNGSMSVRFMTQAGYKDKKREDLKETLDIQISDGAGPRDYEMYSGGEAFRVNFAVRLALSQVLAGRKGARLQTLVIDEGFGSQDDQGRQRLIEAINLVKADFAKILVITHLDELKDAFPTRIEVTKDEHGSAVTVT